MSLFSELKRRNVFRVAAAYLVVGWLLTEVASAVLPTFGAPDWVTKVVVFIFVLGFPIALFVSWAFEVTPEGIQRESEADHESASARTHARRLDIATLIGVVLVAAMFGYQQLSPAPAPDPTGAAPSTTAATPEERPSIAVLAFDNMSPDPENAFFAEGISEEILNVLAGIEGLRVASRTSAFSFAGTDTPITEIADQLDVVHVLEGSVRRQGMRVRITAQLIDAETDTHLWSDTYDRELDDIFAVQEEIANAITLAMRDVLGVQQVTVVASTGDLAAYDLFLHGRQLFFQRGQVALATGIESLQAAVDRDPGFTDAWAYLAASVLVAPGYGTEGWDFDTAQPVAQAAVDRALELDPDNAQALAVKANLIEKDGNGDPLAAMPYYRRAIELAPNDSSALTWLSGTLAGLGYLAESTALIEQAYRNDPLVGIVNGQLGIAYLQQGREELGRIRLDRALELGWFGVLPVEFALSAEAGEIQDFFELFDTLFGPPSDEEGERLRELQLAALDDPAEIPALYALIDEIDARDGHTGWGTVYLALGDADRFFDDLAWALDESPFWGFQMRYMWLPSARWVAEDPRFLALMESKAGIAAAWAELGDPDGCVRVLSPEGERFDCSERFGGPP